MKKQSREQSVLTNQLKATKTLLMPILKRKAFAYITQRNRLLVFSHPYAPAAGIQVPAGTIKENETPAAAVLREAREETDLRDLELVGFLGEQVRDMSDFGRDEVHHRYFYHLRCLGNPPETWRHGEFEGSDGTGPHIFEFWWAMLPDGVPELIAEQGVMLERLLKSIFD
jgi:8-oxo-dGTP pyrophosphatase MutT (NUDIX family)